MPTASTDRRAGHADPHRRRPPQVPWDDLRYLFGEIMYGGHITDDWDRRLCRTYLMEYIRAEMLEGEIQLAPGFQIPPNLDYKVRTAWGTALRGTQARSVTPWSQRSMTPWPRSLVRASSHKRNIDNRARSQGTQSRGPGRQPLGRGSRFIL